MKPFCCRIVHLVVIIFVSLVHKEVVLATKHAVGGSQGWDESTDFDSWSSSQTFRVGDQLDFKYTPMHSVVELPNESAFKSCDINSPLSSLNGGSNTVKLDKAGTRYFACGTSGHCQQGMKVKITTVAADAPPSSSSSATGATTTPSSSHPASAASHQLQSMSLFALIATLLVSIVLFI